MNPADQEINVFLPLAFGVVIVLLTLSFGLSFWILVRFKVIKITNREHLFGVLKAAVFTLTGVFVISGLFLIAPLVFQTISSYFSK